LVQNEFTTLNFASSLAQEFQMHVQLNIPKFIHLQDVDSTNNYIANLVRNGHIDSGTVVSADFQHDGRGQRATKWQSLIAQNALFSVYLKWKHFELSNQFQISMITALAIARTLEQLGLQKVKIKWPNDIYVADKKISGILIENDMSGQLITSSIVGIGLNVNQIEFDPSIRATSIKLESGQMQSVTQIIQQITKNLLKTLENFTHDEIDFHALKTAYLQKLLGFDQKVWVIDTNTKREFKIKILDIAKTGHLLASDECNELKRFDIKDIVWKWDAE
jgi:BirA family transcriptional regulator, biotin operon repressor / biotin---[acetyl-CoA-carboxylase] ligase